MARQRFIWPTIWDDPALGRATDGERLLYIACFSLADDEGRLVGDPAWLRSRVFGFRNVTEDKVRKMRDALALRCSNFCVYAEGGHEYIAFLNWSEFQKPKYPKPSKFPQPSGSIPETLEEGSAIGLGRDGLGRDGKVSNSSNGYVLPEFGLTRLLRALHDQDPGTEGVIKALAHKHGLAEADFAWAHECATGPGVESPTAVAVAELKKRGAEKAA